MRRRLGLWSSINNYNHWRSVYCLTFQVYMSLKEVKVNITHHEGEAVITGSTVELLVLIASETLHVLPLHHTHYVLARLVAWGRVGKEGWGAEGWEEEKEVREEDTGRREGRGSDEKQMHNGKGGKWDEERGRGERRRIRSQLVTRWGEPSNKQAITLLWTQPIGGRAAASPVTSRSWSSRVQRPSAQRGASSRCSSCHHGWAVLPLTLGEFCFWTVPKEGGDDDGRWNGMKCQLLLINNWLHGFPTTPICIIFENWIANSWAEVVNYGTGIAQWQDACTSGGTVMCTSAVNHGFGVPSTLLRYDSGLCLWHPLSLYHAPVTHIQVSRVPSRIRVWFRVWAWSFAM